MNAILSEIYRHNLWANLRLLDTCATLGNDDLDASAPGTYGRVRDTLVHLVGAEEGYAAALSGTPPENPLRGRSAFPSFAELREHAQRSGEALIAAAEQIAPGTVVRGTRRGQPYAIRAEALLIQAVNHATEHRAHVVSILSQRGVVVPDLDGWAYAEAVGLT